MSSLNIGLSGLLVSQRMIDLTGQNITNANTPGYHRQVGELADVSGGLVGSGVQLESVTRVISQVLENAITQNTAAQNQSGAALDGLNQLQSYLAPGTGSLNDALTNFFNAAETLSTSPNDPTQRRVFLSAAGDLADQLNAATDNIQQMRTGLVTQAKSTVDQVNGLTSQIADLNQQIHEAVARGEQPNALQDQLDTAMANLAQLVDVRTIPQDFGQVNVLSDGTPLVLNSTAIPISATVDKQNNLVIHSSDSLQAIDVNGGSLGGTLSLVNTTLPGVQAQLNTFAQTLATQLNTIQAQGIGLNGPLTSLTSSQSVSKTNLPLTVAGLPFPVTAGNLFITVTNQATGQRTLNRVSIDPATQSLASVATSISAIPNFQATTNAQTGTLNLIAKPGYTFDFAGNFSTSPDSQAITGTATPTFDGTYAGSANDTLNYSVVGSGTIGATPGLSLEVRNGAGTLLTSLNIGQGYEPGTDLGPVLGVNVKLSAGTVNAGDSFSLQVAANSDSTGLLSALGLNSFFTGGVGSLHVNRNLLDHPENLALSTTGQPGDGTNLARIVALGNQPVLSGNSPTFEQFLANVIGDVGAQAKDMQARKSAQDALAQQLSTQQQSLSGVDPNEELMKLVQFQQSYQFSAHFVSVVTQSVSGLLSLLGGVSASF